MVTSPGFKLKASLGVSERRPSLLRCSRVSSSEIDGIRTRCVCVCTMQDRVSTNHHAPSLLDFSSHDLIITGRIGRPSPPSAILLVTWLSGSLILTLAMSAEMWKKKLPLAPAPRVSESP